MSKEIPYMIVNESQISALINGELILIDKEIHQKFDDILEALQNKDFDDIENMLSFKSKIKKEIEENQSKYKDLKIGENYIIYKDLNIKGALLDKLKRIIESDGNLEYFIKFLDNLNNNPKKEIFSEIYDYLSKNNMPITNNGTFLAYKKVKSSTINNKRELLDCYTGRIINSVGTIVSMPRENCNPNAHKTCTSGLHVCGFEYLKSYSGSVIIICEVNPKDVVAIPSDYNHSKMRCCSYKVLEEVTNANSNMEKVLNVEVIDLDNDIIIDLDTYKTDIKSTKTDSKSTKTDSKSTKTDSKVNDILDLIFDIFKNDSVVKSRVISVARTLNILLDEKTKDISMEKCITELKKLNVDSYIIVDLIEKIQKTRPRNKRGIETLYIYDLVQSESSIVDSEITEKDVKTALNSFRNDGTALKALKALHNKVIRPQTKENNVKVTFTYIEFNLPKLKQFWKDIIIKLKKTRPGKKTLKSIYDKVE